MLATSDVNDTHSGSDSAGTQSESGSANTLSEPDDANAQTVTGLTVEDVPTLVPDVLNLREKKYEDMPFLETQEQLSEYALWNLLYGRTEFEFRLSWDLSYGLSQVALSRACEAAMSYYLFSSYKGYNPELLIGVTRYDDEHEADENMAGFIQAIHEAARGG